MRLKKEVQQSRRALVRELFLCGFFSKAIAKATGIPQATVESDVARIRATEGLPERPQGKEATQRKALLRYAELAVEGYASSRALREALEVLLKVDSIRAFLDELERFVRWLKHPVENELEAPYERLVRALRKKQGLDRQLDGWSFWRYSFLYDLARGRITPVPTVEMLPQALFVEYLKERRQGIMPVWPTDIREILTKNLRELVEELPERRRQVLERRFLGDQDRSMKQVGAELGISASAVMHHEGKALDSLLVGLEKRKLFLAFSSADSIMARAFFLERECELLIKKVDELSLELARSRKALTQAGGATEGPEAVEEVVVGDRLVPLAALLVSIDDLEVSVRTHNCLRNANIRCLGEAVQKRPEELLKVRLFGRKSLNELSEALERHGLAMGMTLGAEVEYLLARWRESRQ